MRRPEIARLTTALALALLVVSCGEDSTPEAPPPVVAPPPSPTPSPTPTPTPTPTPSPALPGVSVNNCVSQMAVPGRTVANLVVPDVVHLDMTIPGGFPNGRRLQDPVIDITLGAILLDLRVHQLGLLASVPVNPGVNEVPFQNVFPYLAPPNGTQPPPGQGSNFNFRTDPASAYVRVDRMGMPAVATALIIGNDDKNAYNDSNPSDDAAGVWVAEIVSSLQTLHATLRDDLIGLSLTPCSTVS